MKKNTTARLFFVFIAYFILAILLGSASAFTSQILVAFLQKALHFCFNFKVAYALDKIFMPGLAFALACTIIAIGQYYLTTYLQLALKDKIMAFAALCIASFFCGSALARYSVDSLFVFYNMRWFPCELCSFLSGIAALSTDGPIFAASTEDEEEK